MLNFPTRVLQRSGLVTHNDPKERGVILGKKRPVYAELQAWLEQARATLDALRRGEIDPLLGEAGPLAAQYKTVMEELARLRAEVEESAGYWQATFDAAGDAIWILDAEQRVVRANRAAEAVFGCPLAEMPGRLCFEIAHHTETPIPGCPFCLMRVSRQRESFEMQLGERWYLVTVDPLKDSEGNLTGAVHIARDISERKEAEAALQRRCQELTAVYETSQRLLELLPLESLAQKIIEILESSLHYTYGAVLLIDEATGRLEPFALSTQGQGMEFVEADKAYIRSTGIRLGEGITGWVALHGESVRLGDVRQDPRYFALREDVRSELCVPLRLQERVIGVVNIESTEADAYSEDDQRLLENIAAQISVAIQNARLYEQAQQEIEERKQVEVQLRLAHAELGRLLDEAEQAQHTLLSVIEEQKATEQALRESEERFRRLAENAQDLIYRYEFAPQRGFTYVSPAATAITGYTPEEHYADPDLGLKLIHPDDWHLLEAYFQGSGLFHKPLVLRWVRKDGQIIYTEQRNAPIYDAQGNLIAIEGIARDITERMRAEEEIQRRLTELTILYENSQAFTQMPDPASIARHIVNTLAQHMNWRHIAIRQKRPGSDELELLAFDQAGLQPEHAEAVRQHMQRLIPDIRHGLSGYAIQTGQAIRGGDVTRYPQYIETYPGIRSGMYVPMKIGNEVTGVIAVESEEADAFSEHDERLLNALAAQAAVAIENARLFEAERAGRQRLEVIYRLGLALAQTLDLPTIYRTAYEHIVQVVDCPIFGISRYDQATQTLRAEYMLEEGELLDPARFPPLTFQADTPLKGRARAILAQQPTIVSVLPTSPAAGVFIVGAPGDERTARSALYVPIVVRGQTLGLLEVQSYRENAYSEENVALLGPVAAQIGLALENAGLFAELEAERDLLAQRVRERTAQLEAANKELEAFAYSVSHDLRAPLRSLDGFSTALLSRYHDQLDEQGRHYLERIQAASQRMGELIQDLLDLSRVSRREMSRQTVDLSALAREIAAELQAQAPQRQAEFRIANGLTAEGDPSLLRVALENLLGNAWKFTVQREQAVIEFGKMEVEGEPPFSPLIFFVRDNGVGFDMTYADKLFAPFQRLHSQREFPGTGIGLATVQRIIARHGGRVWAEAAPDRGATFYFTLSPGI